MCRNKSADATRVVSSSPSSSSSGRGEAITMTHNPAAGEAASQTAGALLRQLQAAPDLQTAFRASVAFNSVKWSNEEKEYLSVTYCQTALASLRLFAAPGCPLGTVGIEAAAQTLYWLSGTEASRALLAPTDAVPLLVSLLVAPGSIGAGIKCCEALVRLTMSDDMEKAAVAHGAHIHAIRHLGAIAAMPASAMGPYVDAAIEWAHLLSFVTFADDNRRAACAAGGLPLLLHALTPGAPLAQNAKAAQWLAQGLSHLIATSDEARAEAVSRGALQACVALLSGPLACNEEVVSDALCALLACVALPANVLPAVQTGAFAAAVVRVEQPAAPGSSTAGLRFATRLLGYASRSPDGVAALAADGQRAMRAVTALSHSYIAAARDATVVEAVAWAMEQFRAAGFV